ncbi:hypothetical protein MRX96_037874 [Rhipicephalus microplus]
MDAKPGRRRRIAESYRDEAPERTEIGRDIARHFVVLPLPRNIRPQRNKERRVARARALAETHARDSTVVYVDAAKHQYRPHTYVAVVVRATDGKLLSACSVRATSAEQAEEAAIALALNGTEVTTILSDSRTAMANFGRGSIGTPAASLPPRSKFSASFCPQRLSALGVWREAQSGMHAQNPETVSRAKREEHALFVASVPPSGSRGQQGFRNHRGRVTTPRTVVPRSLRAVSFPFDASRGFFSTNLKSVFARSDTDPEKEMPIRTRLRECASHDGAGNEA